METPQSKRNSTNHTLPQSRHSSSAAKTTRWIATRLGIFAAIVAGISGCSVRKIKDPLTGAVIYESHRFGNAEKFDSITATYVDKDGNTNSICIRGYISDQVAGMKAAFEGAGTLVGKGASAMVKP